VTASSSPFELEIVATGRPRLIQSLRELWGYRGTILAFAERDIRVKYKQSVHRGPRDFERELLLPGWHRRGRDVHAQGDR
jgi:hypothetical protein